MDQEKETAIHRSLLNRTKREVDRLYREAKRDHRDLSESVFFVVDPTSDVFGGEPFPVDLPRFGGAYVVITPVETLAGMLHILGFEDTLELISQPINLGEFRIVSVAGVSVRITDILPLDQASIRGQSNRRGLYN